MLADRGVQLNGVVLVSTVLNFADFSGDQAAVDFLPTYAADAFYHGKLQGAASLESVVADARAFAAGPYAAALQEAVGLPVYDIFTMVSWFRAGLRPRRFGRSP